MTGQIPRDNPEPEIESGISTSGLGDSKEISSAGHQRDADQLSIVADESQLSDMIELFDRVKTQAPEILSDIFDAESLESGSTSLTKAAGEEASTPGDTLGSIKRLFSSQDDQPIRIGDFEVVEQVGFGGSGVVFRAVDTRLKRTVALKIPHPEALVTKRLRERFVREAEAAAALDHPNIVPVYAAGTDGVVSYIAYAFFEGETLHEWLGRQDRLPEFKLVARILKAVADGIHHAHLRGILHRDIKPSNVMIAFREDSTQPSSNEIDVRVTDFGMARVEADDVEATRTGTILGTPAYMAPEQSRGAAQVLGPTADVYSLGALLYEMLTGVPPFQNENVVDLLQAVRKSTPTPPSRRRADVPRDLEVLAMRCLDKDPQARLPSAQYLAEELQRFQNGQSIRSRPDSAPTALYKWSRRYPQIAGLAVALFLVGLIGTAGVFWQWRKASSALVAVSQAEQEKAALLEETQSQLYVHRIGLAHRELLDGRSSRASQLLDECQPARREWDWHYLQRLAHQESRTWSDFTLYPHDLALSPDGQRMLVVECLFNHPERKGGWQLIDLKSGEVVMRHEHQHGGLIGCAFAPDGKTFATCGQSPDQKRTLCVWDAITGEEKWHTGRTKSEAHVTYSPDGSTLATAGHDGKIRLWDTQGNLLHSLRQGKQNNFQVDFHPTQPWLASVSRAGKLCVWHAESGELLHSKQVYGDFRSVKFSPSGRWLAVVGYQSYLAVMDVNDGYRTVLKGGEPIAEVAGLFAVGFSPDQKRLLACGTSGEAFLWDMEKLKFESSLNAHSEAIFDCQWLDEHRFVTCSDVSKSVKEWDLRQLDRPRAVPVHNVCTSDMAVGASGKLGVLTTNYNHFYGGEEDFDLKLVDLDSLQTIKSLKGHETWHTAVAVSRDERNAVSGDKNGRVFYWDLESGKREKELLRKEDDSPAIEIGFAEKDDSIFAVTANGNRFQWDRATGELMGQATLAEKIDIAVFDEPTTECLLANGSQLELWNIDPPKRLSTWAIESPDFENDNKKANDSASESHLPIVELALSQSKNLVAVALEKAVYVWRRDIEGRIDLKSVTVIREPADRITSIAFNPNGRRLAIGNENTTVRIWDPTFGAETLTLRAANQSRGVISECRFSLDGSQLFACHTFITAWSGDDIGEAPRSPSQDD